MYDQSDGGPSSIIVKFGKGPYKGQASVLNGLEFYQVGSTSDFDGKPIQIDSLLQNE